jgi:hypothetical protein
MVVTKKKKRVDIGNDTIYIYIYIYKEKKREERVLCKSTQPSYMVAILLKQN